MAAFIKQPANHQNQVPQPGMIPSSEYSGMSSSPMSTTTPSPHHVSPHGGQQHAYMYGDMGGIMMNQPPIGMNPMTQQPIGMDAGPPQENTPSMTQQDQLGKFVETL